MVKADGGVAVFSELKIAPLMWMSPPCTLREEPGKWTVTNKAGEQLLITIEEVVSDVSADLGIDPGLQKDGVEAHLQVLLADNCAVLGEGFTLVRREFPTDIGPVDLMCRDEEDGWVAVEIKRVGTIEAVEQLSRYLEVLQRDPALAECRGILAAESVKPQARTLCAARGLGWVEVELAAVRGEREPELTLFET
jgi:hypothetical protein